MAAQVSPVPGNVYGNDNGSVTHHNGKGRGGLKERIVSPLAVMVVSYGVL